MCGICGILHFDPQKKVDEVLLRRMAYTMRHRGPDDEGFYLDGPIGLGHRRLSIIDLSSGHQPMSNDNSTVWIVFNGEIYNYRELAEELKSKGHQFRTHSDTETIIHAYEEYGESCVDKLRGMFAFAIWDSSKRQLLLARDRVGIKPVYFTIYKDTFYFASEIKSILEQKEVPRELHTEAVNYYLSFRYCPGQQTLFRNIYKLPPGTLIVVGEGSTRVKQYWDLQFQNSDGLLSLGEWCDRFEEKLTEALDIHLISDVPLGAFLSGGIDSSLLVALMSQMVKEPVKTFSVGYENKPHINEFAFARQVAARYGSQHRELEITSHNFSEYLPRLVWHLDEPVADYACLPLYFMSELTRKHVTVIISGEGADELLAGYSIYKKMLFIERLRTIVGLGGLVARTGSILPAGKLRRYMLQAGIPLSRRYHGVSTAFTEKEIFSIYPSGSSENGQIQDFITSIFERVKGQHPLNQMLYFDTRVYLPDDLLIKADKMTMANSLELRVPFLDHELMELSARLPVESKYGGGETKRILRKIAQPLLPQDILLSPKRGFPVPTKEWFAEDLNHFARKSLLEKESSLRDLFDNGHIKRILDRHEAALEDCSDRIWTLLVLEYWKRVFIDSSEVPDLGGN